MPAPVVFISSTIEDLKEYRTAAKEAAIRAGFAVHMSDYFAASAKEPYPLCMEKVDPCDVLVVIVAHRYGWKPDDQPLSDVKKSITWLECERARKNVRDVLAFVVDEKFTWPLEKEEAYRAMAVVKKREMVTPELNVDIQESIQNIPSFKDWLKGTYSKFTTPQDLELLIFQALKEWRDQHPDKFDDDLPHDTTRYLNYLRADTQYLDIRGVKSGDGSAKQFQIDQLYIPLKTQTTRPTEKQKGKGPHLEMPEQPRSELLQNTLKEKRLLIKGDPGAGKSTFCRLLVFSLCQRLLHEPATGKTVIEWPEKAPLPILVRIGELTEHQRNARDQHCGDAPKTETSPDWLLHFLDCRAREHNWGLDRRFFKEQLTAGNCLILLDGLDEAPDETRREKICEMATNIINAYEQCQVVLTSRPAALEDGLKLDAFTPVMIEPLDQPAIHNFLDMWCSLLYVGAAKKQQDYRQELNEALTSRPEIRRMARTPIMLTCLAVVHWNQNKLPEQRAELYEAILGWLFEQRKNRPGRLPFRQCRQLIQALARAMFCHPDGRQRQVPIRWGAEQLMDRFDGNKAISALKEAEYFLRDELVDSGIIVARSGQLEFWHLSFQEYLAAFELGGFEDRDMKKMLFNENHLFQSEWREVLLLLGGVLWKSGVKRLDGLVNEIITRTDPADLKSTARTVALLSAMSHDLQVFDYTPANKTYPALLQQVNGIFDKNTYRKVKLPQRCDIADELARNGDPRFYDFDWIKIPAGEFWMGAQKEHPHENNYDKMARGNEGPVHRMKLSGFEILKYPVTVAQYARFVENNGYLQPEFWTAGGFKDNNTPDEWDEQQEHPARPIVNVSWFEATAFAAFLSRETGQQITLPAEAQWERAGRGKTGFYRSWSWGTQEPDVDRTNWKKAKLGHASPVGIFPVNATDNGILDLSGNVWEWCTDWYDDERGQFDTPSEFYRKTEETENPVNAENGQLKIVGPKKYRVWRGGSFFYDTGDLRCSVRSGNGPIIRGDYFGFRLVRALS